MSTAAETVARPPRAGSTSRKRGRRRRTPKLSEAERWAIYATAAVGAVAGCLAGARPTGAVLSDALWASGCVGAVTLLSARAKRATLVWLAGIATAMSVGDLWVIAGGSALCLCAISITSNHRMPVLNAATGALASLSLLHSADLLFFGLPSALSAVAVAPVVWSGLKYTTRQTRRRIGIAAAVAVCLSALAGVGFALAAVSARTEVEAAVTKSQEAVSAVRSGDQAVAGRLFGDASGHFQRANDALSSPWAWPARAVPVLGVQANALVVASRAGGEVAGAAEQAASAAPYRDLKPRAGTIDLSLMSTMSRPLDGSVGALKSSIDALDGASSGWMLPTLKDEIDRFTGALKDALPDAELAAEAVKVAPELLGGSGPRRYFLAFATPAEARFQGGFIGAYGELSAEAGKVSLTRTGSIEELSDAPGASERHLGGSKLYQQRYSRFQPARFFQNLTASPDWPANTTAIGDLYPQAGGSPVSGAIYVDPYGLAALLKLTGPVTLEGVPEPLTAENAARYLLVEQYLTGEPSGQRKDRLLSASKQTFEALTTRDLPSPKEIVEVLGPVVRGGHLLFSTKDKGPEDFLKRIGLTGGFIETAGREFLDVRTSNSSGNKIDAYLQREIDYQGSYDQQTGKVDAALTISLRNDAPASGLPDYVIANSFGLPAGTNRMLVSVFTSGEVDRATIDGSPLALQREDEYGGRVYSALVAVPPTSVSTIELHMSGSLPAGSPFRFAMGHQPLVKDDHVKVSVGLNGEASAVGAGWAIEAGHGRWEGELHEPIEVSLEAVGQQ